MGNVALDIINDRYVRPPWTQWDMGIGPRILPVRITTRTSVARIPSRSFLGKAETKKRPWVEDTRLSNTQVPEIIITTSNHAVASNLRYYNAVNWSGRDRKKAVITEKWTILGITTRKWIILAIKTFTRQLGWERQTRRHCH